MAKSSIKQIQVIVRPVLLKSNLPSSIWGHAVRHATQLLRSWSSLYHVYSPHQLMTAFVNESDPQTIQEAKASPFWDKWKEVI